MIITYIFTSFLFFLHFQLGFPLQELLFATNSVTGNDSTIQIHKSFLMFYLLFIYYLCHNVRDDSRGHRGGLHTLRCPRIAKRLRYCRIMRMIHRNAEAWTPRQGEIEPWMASFDGFVKLRKTLAQFVQSLSCVA